MKKPAKKLYFNINSSIVSLRLQGETLLNETKKQDKYLHHINFIKHNFNKIVPCYMEVS